MKNLKIMSFIHRYNLLNQKNGYINIDFYYPPFP